MLLIFRKSTRRCSLQNGFPCAKIGLPYLVNGRMVKMPLLCNRANYTVMSTLMLIGVGRL